MSDLATRLDNAMRILVGDGPVKQRLARAFGEHLADLHDSEWPTALRPQFVELALALTRVRPAGKEGPVRATVQKMSFGEAADHAATIARLYALLMAASSERAEPLKVVTTRPEAAPSRRYASGG